MLKDYYEAIRSDVGPTFLYSEEEHRDYEGWKAKTIADFTRDCEDFVESVRSNMISLNKQLIRYNRKLFSEALQDEEQLLEKAEEET